MQAHSQLPSSHTPATPLVNLFAYIRDLFHTAQPERFFDVVDGKKQDSHWFVVSDILTLTESKGLLPLEWQAQNPDKPILTIKRMEGAEKLYIPPILKEWIFQDAKGSWCHREEIETSFSSEALRVKVYESFAKQIAGKALDEVSDLIIPETIEAWVELSEEEGKIHVEHQEAISAKFADDPERVALWSEFQTQKNTEAYTTKLNGIYDKLHSWLYQLKSQPDFQIFFSFGLLQGGTGKNAYKNYLFHIPLKIELARQEIKVFVDTVAHEIRCEQHFSELIPDWFPQDPGHIHEQRQREVIQRIDQFQQQRKEFSLELDYVTHAYYHPALDILGIFPNLNDQFFSQNQLQYHFPEATDERFTFSFAPVIQLRNPGIHINVSKDASQIMEHIQSLGPQEAQHQVPAFFKKLFSLKKPDNPMRIAYKGSRDFKTAQPQLNIQAPGPDRLYFPLPYNEEQKAIALRLYDEDAATVQGPPGTGKSHTIANLAAHYAAEGKSVLIVSKYAKALEVIRGKLPESIRDLALSFADNEQHRELLKHAIDAVKARLNDPISEEDIYALTDELEALEHQQVQLKAQMVRAIGLHGESIRLFDPIEGKIVQRSLTAWASQWEDLPEALADGIPSDAPIQRWAASLYPLLVPLQAVDLSLASLFLPAPEHLPQPEEVNQRGQEVNKWRTKVDGKAYQYLDEVVFGEEIQEKWQHLKGYMLFLQRQSDLWTAPEFSLPRLQMIIQRAQQLQEKIDSYPLPSGPVDTSPLQGLEMSQLPHAIVHLQGKFNRQGKLSLLKKKSLSPKEKALLNCKLNGQSVSSPEDLSTLSTLIKRGLFEQQLIEMGQEFLLNIGATTDDPVTVDTWKDWEKGFKAYERVAQWNQYIAQWHLAPVNPFEENLAETINWWEGLPHCRAYRQALSHFRALQTRIPQTESSHPKLKALEDALEALDGVAYKEAFTAYVEFTQEVTAARELASAMRPWMEKLPSLIQDIASGTGPSFSSEAELLERLHSSQLHQVLSEALNQVTTVPDLLDQLRHGQLEIRQLTRRLIEMKAWYHKQLHITDAQRSALSAWRNDLINLGKGYGKNAARHMESAIHNLKLAKGVVPIWIMSLDAAIRFFPEPDPGQFDLLIVDEASQVDISALNLIYRAKKSLVVGDENQTSVFTNSAMFPIERTNQILDRYLEQHPFKQQFNINNRTASIYSLSGVIYPNVITLKEHFRCRPEIISFSNQFVYDKHIIPLRTATHGWYGQPAEVHYIEDGGRDKKKAKLAEGVLTLIEGVIEDYEQGHIPQLPSIGILCLESSNEAHRELVQRMILKSTRIKTYQDQLRLLVGTSREFQGDERDVMILTTTANHTLTKAGSMRAPRAVMGEEMMRIYNVAVSRAREKVILLHSIHPEAIAMMNENCYRARLIRHLSSLSQVQQPILRKVIKTSPLHEEVQAWLAETFPTAEIQSHHQLGPYKMDLALMGDHGKWAFWLDEGQTQDAEMLTEKIQLQLTLERAGWKGWRISSLEWATQKEVLKERLREEMKEMAVTT
ncbi:MAG: AAA family ATPase [Bacteroidota bacterium]